MQDFYIYFNTDTDEILAVCPHESKDHFRDPYILVDYNTGAEFVLGTKNVRDWIVMRNEDGDFKLTKAIQYVSIPKPKVSNHFPKVEICRKLEDTFDSHLVVVANPTSGVLNFVINKNSLTLRTVCKTEFAINGLDILQVYITKLNNPYALLKTLNIELKALLENGFLSCDVSDIREEYSIFIPGVFDKTALVYLNEEFNYEIIAGKLLSLSDEVSPIRQVENPSDLPVLSVDYINEANSLLVWMPFIYRIVALKLKVALRDIKLQVGSDIISVPIKSLVSNGYVIYRNVQTKNVGHHGDKGLVNFRTLDFADTFSMGETAESIYKKLFDDETCIIKNSATNEIILFFSKDDLDQLDSTKENMLVLSDAYEPLMLLDNVKLNVDELKSLGCIRLDYNFYKDNKLKAFLQYRESLKNIEVIQL